MTDSEENVDRFMQRSLVSIWEGTTLVLAAKAMAEQKVGCLLVDRDDEAGHSSHKIGLVSETDLVRKGLARGVSLSNTTVSQIMVTPLQTIPSGATMVEASHVMEQFGVRHLCVAKGEEVLGLISVRDLVNHFVYEVTGPLRDLDDVYRPLSILMQSAMVTIDRQTVLSKVASLMGEKRIGSLLVTQNGVVVGIVTERDLIQKVVGLDQDPSLVTAGSIMSSPLVDIDINRTLHDASDLMAEKGIRHLAVTENHVIVGILSVRDLVRMISVRDRPRFLREKRKHQEG